MPTFPTVIPTPRLDLVSLTAKFLEATLADDHAAAESLLGLTIPAEWYEERSRVTIRLSDLRRDPTLQPWLLRAMALRDTRQMVGVIGFHTRPGPTYLQPYAPGGIEIGYSVFADFRRRGFASEACQALMAWAADEHAVQRFVLTIGNDNTASRGVATKLGFAAVAEIDDDDEGPSAVYVLDLGSSS